MAQYKITLLGAYQWMKNNNRDLFAYMNLPDGIEKEQLENTILMNGAEFEILYADPEFMVDLIGIWSKKWYHTIERWIKLVNIDYEPLENYDRHEEWTDDGVSATSGHSTGNSTGTGYKSAYDEGGEGWSPKTKDVMDTSNGTEANANTNSNHKGWMHGNIGVTTNVQMAEQEVSFWKNFNLYDEVASLFLQELVVYTY